MYSKPVIKPKIHKIYGLCNDYLNDNKNKEIPSYIQISFKQWINTIKRSSMRMDNISKYITSSSLLLDSNKEIKSYLMNKLFNNLEYVEIFSVNDIDLSSLLFELKEINHNLNTTKLKKIEIWSNNKIIDIDSFNKYLIDFKHNKWNMEHKEEYGFKYIWLNRF